MLYEKKKLIIYKSMWLILLLLGIIIPIISVYAPKGNVKIINDNGYVNDYYETLDKTDCEIEVVFNVEVDSGYIKVAFYDINNNLLSTETKYFSGYDKTLSSTFLINGKVDSYQILDYDISASDNTPYLTIMFFVYGNVFIFAFFITSLFLSYKVYEFNENEIVIYAGWYKHYIKVNGQKLDEHNTLVSFTPIMLSCTLEDGTDIDATITTANRIALKINNRLYDKRK